MEKKKTQKELTRGGQMMKKSSLYSYMMKETMTINNCRHPSKAN